MRHERGWRGVLVPPPNPRVGIGKALRHAFPVNAAMRSMKSFSDLLARLRSN